MKLLKAIDLYGKVPKGLAEPTSSGAVVSILTLVFLGLMIFNEFIEYISIDVQSEIMVDEQRSKERILVNMDIKFVRAPCEFLEIESQDAMGSGLSENYIHMRYFRLDSSENNIGEFKRDPNNFINIEDARKAVAEKQGCQIVGNISINKVRGKISFAPHKSHSYIGAVGNLPFPIDYSHKFISFTFGDESQLQKVRSNFSNGQLETLAGTQRIKKYELAAQGMQHEHFINIIPTHFTLLNKQTYLVYQYTVNHNEVRAPNLPSVQLRYDFAPTTVNFWQTKEDLLHFLVQVCAVIGGIFTVSSMIEASVYRMMRTMLKREWQKFIQPQRYNYSYFDLGPEYIQVPQGYLRRHESIFTNRQNSKLEMSFFELNPKTTNCIVYCHGYNGCRIEGIKYAAVVAQYGFNFCTFDFQACGHSEGECITFGHLEKDDITSVLEELERKFQQTAFILWGRSLGATTIQLKRQPNILGVVLDSCFMNFNKLAVSIIQKQTRLPKFLIKAIIFFTKGSVEEQAGFQINDIQVQCDSTLPTLYICSDKDSLIKSKNSLKLYQQHQGVKRLIKVDGEHNDSRPIEVIHQICLWCKDRVKPISYTAQQYSSVPQVSRLPLELIYDANNNNQSVRSSSYNRGLNNPAIKLKNQISIQLRTSCRNLHSVVQY